jgi:hypothetical protein
MGTFFFDMPIIVIYMDNAIISGYGDFGMHLADVTELFK